MITAGTTTIRSLFPSRRPIDRPSRRSSTITPSTTSGCWPRSRSTRSPTTSSATAAVPGRLRGRACARAGDRDGHLGVGLLRLRQELVHQVSRLRPRPDAAYRRAAVPRPAARAHQRARAGDRSCARLAHTAADGGDHAGSRAGAVGGRRRPAQSSTSSTGRCCSGLGYSKEKKLAQLELRLERDGRLEEFKRPIRAVRGRWEDDPQRPAVGVARADKIVPAVLSRGFPTAGAFRRLRFSLAGDVRDLARRDARPHSAEDGHEQRALPDRRGGPIRGPPRRADPQSGRTGAQHQGAGQGRVWIVATGQQTLSEIVEKAAASIRPS